MVFLKPNKSELEKSGQEDHGASKEQHMEAVSSTAHEINNTNDANEVCLLSFTPTTLTKDSQHRPPSSDHHQHHLHRQNNQCQEELHLHPSPTPQKGVTNQSIVSQVKIPGCHFYCN